jgi:calcineurin-like phosphoesterase family protein
MKEYKFNPDKIYFTSDLHIAHEKIIEYSHRPFASVEEMNETLIKNWNDTVPDDGIVFDLGDFAIGGSKVWNDALSQLKGKHYLITGNHDMKNFREGYSKHFELVTQQMYIQVEDVSIYLNHFPFLCFGGAYREQHNVWNLHGHVHLEPQAKGRDIKRVLQYSFPTQYDVGVDNNGYKPVSYWEVKEIIEKQVEEYKNK